MNCDICNGYEEVIDELKAEKTEKSVVGYYATSVSIMKQIIFVEQELTKHKLRDCPDNTRSRVRVTTFPVNSQ